VEVLRCVECEFTFLNKSLLPYVFDLVEWDQENLLVKKKARKSHQIREFDCLSELFDGFAGMIISMVRTFIENEVCRNHPNEGKII
jgi:hypothetical protein